MTEHSSTGPKPDILWAQLVELEHRSTDDDLSKARVVAQIIERDGYSTREFAKCARERYHLDGLGSHVSVVRLTQWLTLVEQALEAGVVPAGTTPPEGTLRPLFAKHIPAGARLDLLDKAAKASGNAHIAAADVRKVVKAEYPRPKRKPKHPTPKRIRDALPQVDELCDRYGWFTVLQALQRLEDRYLEEVPGSTIGAKQTKQRPTKEDTK